MACNWAEVTFALGFPCLFGGLWADHFTCKQTLAAFSLAHTIKPDGKHVVFSMAAFPQQLSNTDSPILRTEIETKIDTHNNEWWWVCFFLTFFSSLRLFLWLKSSFPLYLLGCTERCNVGWVPSAKVQRARQKCKDSVIPEAKTTVRAKGTWPSAATVTVKKQDPDLSTRAPPTGHPPRPVWRNRRWTGRVFNAQHSRLGTQQHSRCASS